VAEGRRAMEKEAATALGDLLRAYRETRGMT
jgi:hypothetical protein